MNPRSSGRQSTQSAPRAERTHVRRHGLGSRSTVRRGFTLIEILLAVMIFAIVLVAMHVVFQGALRLRNKTAASLEAAVPMQQALAIIHRDLAGLVAPGSKLAGPLQTTPTGTTATVIGQVSPQFFTAVGVLNDTAPWSEVQRVTYRLADPTNDSEGLDLYRSVTRNLLAMIEDAPEDQFLMGGVETLTFQYYDGTQWRYDWDSSVETNILPGAIKVQLLLSSTLTNRFDADPIELVVPVTVQPDTDTVAETTEGGT